MTIGKAFIKLKHLGDQMREPKSAFYGVPLLSSAQLLRYKRGVYYRFVILLKYNRLIVVASFT